MANSLTASKIYLCEGVPFNDSYNDVIDFLSKTAQINYFLAYSPENLRFNNVSYQRVNKSISSPRASMTCRINGYCEQFNLVNYLLFQNAPTYSETTPASGGKWYFAFVKSVNYINPYCTEFVYELDYYQSYMWQFSIGTSFVEREHVSTDVVYSNILQEPVTISEYSENANTYNGTAQKYINVISSETNKGESVKANDDGGIFTGLLVKQFTSASNASTYIESFTHPDAIVAILMTYSLLKTTYPIGGDPFNAPTIAVTPTSINSNGVNYTPKNKKLYNSQFRYFKFTVKSNNSVEFKPEKMLTSRDARFMVSGYYYGNVYPGTAYVFDYEGVEQNFNYCICDEDNIMCGWASDSFKQWLSQNSNKLNTSLLYSCLSIASGVNNSISAFGKNGVSSKVGSVISGIQSTRGVADLISEVADKENLTDKFKGAINSTDANFALTKPSWRMYEMVADLESLKRADTFMTNYGYTTNKIKSPNNRSRTKMNYLKIVDPLIIGKIPVDAFNTLYNMFSKGVKIWHAPIVNIGDDISVNDTTGIEGWVTSNA